ncbi:uncharacterized protein LOC143069723 [Mytilus galloprovincialis]|uniref:uncharacterized protein LOC143069723 n=1 Tax=Mytilus galloprovincialis TaxID=29158 RepID=UPI003F7CA7A8
MSAPMGHDRSRPKPKEDDEEEDPVDKMLTKTGCKELHYLVQDCMGEHNDWRKCQKEVTEFRKCMEKKSS